MTISLHSIYNIVMKDKKYIRPLLSIIFIALNVHYFHSYKGIDATNTMFTISIVLSILLLSIPIKHIPSRMYQILSTCIILIIPLLLEISVEFCNHNLLSQIEGFGNILLNYLINFIIVMILYVLFASIRKSLTVASVILSIFAIANMYVKQFKGIPLLPWDLSVIKTAAGVASNYQFTFNVQIAYTLTTLACILSLIIQLPRPKKNKYRAIRRLSCAFLSTCILITFYWTDFFQVTLGATPDFFNQTRGYENYGAVAEFVVNTKYLSLKKPVNYQQINLEDRIQRYTNQDTTITHTALQQSPNPTIQKPNIIVIMNEAFSDLKVIGDFQTNQDYMPFENSMLNAKNTIQGNVYVSTIGTGTSNTEYEFLTNNTMAFLPIGSNAYTLYEKHSQPGMAMNLGNQDYSTTAFHPYYKENWNRINTYEYMGFDQFIGLEDIDNYHKLRNYISDEWDFSYITKLYEQRDQTKPFFLFNVTMQNHSPYTTGKLDDIHITSMQGNYPETEEYLSAIYHSDQALKQLVNYFQAQQEPTIILMYGDHQPYIEDEFYEELYDKSLHSLSDKENQKRYITHFFMWANYDIPSGNIPRISANYLQLLLLENAGTALTPYQQFLQTLYSQVPVISAYGCIDSQGKYFTINQKNPYQDILNFYDNLSYNNLIELERRKDDLFIIKPK